MKRFHDKTAARLAAQKQSEAGPDHVGAASWAPCSPGCLGWIPGENTVERCDDCARFADDDEALGFVLGLLADRYATLGYGPEGGT